VGVYVWNVVSKAVATAVRGAKLQGFIDPADLRVVQLQPLISEDHIVVFQGRDEDRDAFEVLSDSQLDHRVVRQGAVY
jgi:hypothetical protein